MVWPTSPKAFALSGMVWGFDQAAFFGRGWAKPAGRRGRSHRAGNGLGRARRARLTECGPAIPATGSRRYSPSRASAKISFRLVGTQDPLAIRESFRQMVQDLLPPDCTVEFKDHGAGRRASVMSTANPIFEKARAALSDEWPRPARSSVVAGQSQSRGHFKDILGLDSMLIGFGRDDDGLHSPNEKYDLESFHKRHPAAGRAFWMPSIREVGPDHPGPAKPKQLGAACSSMCRVFSRLHIIRSKYSGGLGAAPQVTFGLRVAPQPPPPARNRWISYPEALPEPTLHGTDNVHGPSPHRADLALTIHTQIFGKNWQRWRG